MANNYMWKDKYYNYHGALLTDNIPTNYHSPLGSANGDGTRENPFPANKPVFTSQGTYTILSGGYFPMQIRTGAGGNHIIGQGAHLTSVDINIIDGTSAIALKDLTLINCMGMNATQGLNLNNCIISGYSNRFINQATYSLITYDVGSINLGDHNSFIGVSTSANQNFNCNYSIFSDCSIDLTQNHINNYKNNNLAFDDCKFKIGNESEYIPLIGNIEEELRQNFVERCTAQNISVPNVYDYIDNIPVGRWVFSKNSTSGGYVITDSIIDKFQKRKFIKLGWSENTVDSVSLTNDPNKPQSFSSNFPNGGNLDIVEDSISIPDSIDVTDKYETYITSNPFWLGGKYRLNKLNILNNLPSQYGILIDKHLSLDLDNPIKTGEIKIVKDEFYIVRSDDKQPASIKYNEATYTTSLNTRDNIFVGTSGITSFTVLSGNPVIYKVLDIAVQPTIEMRIVNELPTGNITSGNLQSGYWYFIEPNSQNDKSGTITYKGIQYPCMSSFLVDNSNLNFTINGTCHLRRCWREEYTDNSTETTDKSFWANKQKPYWCDIVPNDFRCLKTKNSSATDEMQLDNSNKKYITTGHNDFYKLVNGEAGYILPIYDITGVYVQIRLNISSLNPL